MKVIWQGKDEPQVLTCSATMVAPIPTRLMSILRKRIEEGFHLLKACERSVSFDTCLARISTRRAIMVLMREDVTPINKNTEAGET